MKISVFFPHLLKIADTDAELRALLCRFKAAGLDAVELSSGNIEKLGSEKLAEMLCSSGLSVSAVYANLDLAVTYDRQNMRSIMEAAQNLEASLIHIVPGETRSKETQNVISALEDICKMAEEYGHTVCMENMGLRGCFNSEPKELLTHLRNIKGLYYILDTGNFLCGDADVMSLLPEFKEKLVHVHLKDWRTERHDDFDGKVLVTPKGKELYPSALFEGCIPLDSVMDELKAMDYDGYAVIETFHLKDMESGILRSINNIKERIK